MVRGGGSRLSAAFATRTLRLGEGPLGSIRWPADTDKQGRETLVPVGPTVRQALDPSLPTYVRHGARKELE